MMNNVAYICWQIWKIRCERVMEMKHVGIEEVNMKIKGVVNEFYILKKDIDKEEKRNKERMAKSVERWEKP